MATTTAGTMAAFKAIARQRSASNRREPDWRWRAAERYARAGRVPGSVRNALLVDAFRYLRWRAGHDDDDVQQLTRDRRDAITAARAMAEAHRGGDADVVRHVVQALTYGLESPAAIAARLRRPAEEVAAYVGLFFDLPDDTYRRLERLVVLTSGAAEDPWYHLKLGCLWYGPAYFDHARSGRGLSTFRPADAADLLQRAGVPGGPVRRPGACEAYKLTMAAGPAGRTPLEFLRICGRLQVLDQLHEAVDTTGRAPAEGGGNGQGAIG